MVEGFFCGKFMPTKRFVLASNSPRRVALLKSLGYHFDIIPHTIEEEYNQGDVVPTDLIKNVAYLKANDVARRVNDAIIISADTVVVYNKNILGKPKDISDAKRILSMLSGSEHEIISGVCIIDTSSKKKLLRIDRTYIKMKYMREKEIEMYITSGEPMDKAGAYAIQGEGRKFIEKIEGSYTNAVGLPLELVKEMINNFIKDANTEKF